MSAKTPFEIRLDVLAMAKDFLDKQAEINVEFAAETFQHLVETGKAVAEQWQDYAPVPYTIQDITDKANELYGFIMKTK
jgi:hypothetical protein